VLPTAFHLLWIGAMRADLDVRFDSDSLVTTAVAP
jgi:hypothetical protein